MNIFEENKAYIKLRKAGLAYQHKSNIEDTLRRVDMKKVRAFLRSKDQCEKPEGLSNVYGLKVRILVSRRDSLHYYGYYYRDFAGDWKLQRQYYGE